MVESEMHGDFKPLQVIKNLTVCNRLQAQNCLQSIKLKWEDNPYLLLSLIRKMAQLAISNNLESIHAIFCNLNLPLFILLDSFFDVKAYFNCSYVASDEEMNSLERCFYNDNKQYLVKRGIAMHVVGQRLITDGQPCLVDVEEKLEGKLAILEQQEIDHQNGIFLPDLGLEVEIF